jgi:hypothetical protein
MFVFKSLDTVLLESSSCSFAVPFRRLKFAAQAATNVLYVTSHMHTLGHSWFTCMVFQKSVFHSFEKEMDIGYLIMNLSNVVNSTLPGVLQCSSCRVRSSN